MVTGLLGLKKQPLKTERGMQLQYFETKGTCLPLLYVCQEAHTPAIDMEHHPVPAERTLPLHVVVTVLQFAVPEIMSLG